MDTYNDNGKEDDPPCAPSPTVVDIALSSPDFTILVTALAQEDLVKVLCGSGPFTVFAPTNQAFVNLITALGITVEELLAIPSLTSILLYHVIGDNFFSNDLIQMDHTETLNSQSIGIGGENASTIVLTNQQGGTANIIISDIVATNGVVHAVDAVLLPLFETVLDIALSFDAFSIVVAAVVETGLDEVLTGPGPFTVFAPTNDAFNALMDALGIDIKDLLNIPSLQDIVLYHVIGQFLLTDDLLTLDGKYIETLISDAQTVKIHVDTEGIIMVIDQQVASADLGLSNVQAKNGVVHVIDSVLVPLFQTVLEIAESFDDYSILVTAVNKAQLVEVLEGPGPFTVFAPNNKAFKILLLALDITLQDLLNIPSLRDILLYHVVGEFLLTDDFFSDSLGDTYDNGTQLMVGGRSTQLETLKSDGQSITVFEGTENIKVIDQQNSLTGIAEIILSNVQAKNGVVHVVDRVLLPLFQTVVEIAASFNKFSILVTALESEKLIITLSGEGPFTVFAPTNDAFKQLFREIHIDLDDLLNIPTLRDILLYHVSGEFLLRQELEQMAVSNEPIDTLKSDGQKLKVDIDHKDLFLKDAQSDWSDFELYDVKAKNGVAHVIDRVLIPLFDSVFQIPDSFKDYSILVKLVIHADCAEMLIKDEGPFTVFAPNNMAFHRLMSELMIEVDDLLRLPSLKRVLFYHMIGDYLLSKDLETKQYTTLSGQKVRINSDWADNHDMGFVVNDIVLFDNQDFRSDIIFGNVEAKNGVVHVVNRVMIPLFDNIMEIVTSFKDYSILAQLVHAAGLSQTLMSAGPFTVFAPNNHAFHQLMYELLITIDDLLMLPNLREVLWYHILGGYYLTQDLDTHHLRTLHQRQALLIDVDKKEKMEGFATKGIHLMDQNGDISNMLIKNVQSRNGVLHRVDRVLMLRWETVLQVACSLQDYRIFCETLHLHGLAHFTTFGGPFTVFAPTNQAFVKLAKDIHITMAQLYAIPVLKYMLMYHLTYGYFLSVNLRQQSYMTTIGQPRHIIIEPEYVPVYQGFAVRGISHIDQQMDKARILFGNVETKNGVFYAVDEVLVWTFDSIWQIVTSISDYSILTHIAAHTGIVMDQLIFDGPFTLFAPNNFAFIHLMNELLIDIYDILHMPKLVDVLHHHILPVSLLSCELGPQVIALNGQFLNIVYGMPNDCYGYIINDMHIIDQQSDPAHVLFGNVNARNGPVHVVQRVMMLRFDSVYQIATLFRDYSIVLQLLDITGLYELLISPGHFTVFAPRNEAFYKLMYELRITMEDIISMPALRAILLYHVTEGYLLCENLRGGNIPMMNGQVMNVKMLHCPLYGFAVRGNPVVDLQQRTGMTLLGNVEAFNGVWHAIERVMILMFDTVIDIALQFEDYSILVDLVNAANLTEVLTGEGPFTVLAPNNAAFLQLLDELRITMDDLLTTPILTQTLLYHVLGSYVFTTDLPNAPIETVSGKSVVSDVLNYDGYRGGFDIIGPFFIDGQNDESNMFIGNVQANNGIVHVIDRVMIPLFDDIIQIATAFDDYSILVQLVTAANLTNVLLGPGPFTVFAPNNDAFYALMDELHITIDDLLNLPNLKEILLYHILGAHTLTADLASGDHQTLNGQTIQIINANPCYNQEQTSVESGYEKSKIKGYSGADTVKETVESKKQSIKERRRMQDAHSDFDKEFNFDFNDRFNYDFDHFEEGILDNKDRGLNGNNGGKYEDRFDDGFDDGKSEFDSAEFGDSPYYDYDWDQIRNNTDPNFPLPNITYNFTKPDIIPPAYGEKLAPNMKTGYAQEKYGECDYGFYVTGVSVIDRQDREGALIIGNIEAENGVVHVIDRVLLPMFETVVEIATLFEDYSILVDLVVQAGLLEILGGPGPLAVWAPNNLAFYNLMNELQINIDDLLRLPILSDVLLYHVNGNYLFTNDLSTGAQQQLSEKYIIVNVDNYDGYRGGFDVQGIVQFDGQNDGSNMIIGNVQSDNGIVHVVDRVMIPLFDTVVQIATSFDDYSILVQLVIAADLLDTLLGPGPFTVFAPNNYAFGKLMHALGIDIDDLLNLPNLSDVLLYHIADAYLLSNDLTTGPIQSIFGQNFTIDTSNHLDMTGQGFSLEGITVTDNQQRMGWSVLGNVEAANGVVHVIDEVMLPLFESVVQIATLFDDFSILVAAVTKAGLVDMLLGPGPFTVFAPNNDAFEALMDALQITIDDLLNLPNLSDILLYHVISDNLLSPELIALNGTDLATINGQTVRVNVDNSSDIWLTDGQRRSSDIILSDVQAKNGVVHVINSVMLPLFDTVVDIAASIDEFSILVTALETAGLTDTLRGDGPFTVFAPTNDAFEVLLEALGIGIDDLLAHPNLSEILLYHVLGGNGMFTFEDLLNMYIYDGISIVTLNGETVTVNVELEDEDVIIVDKRGTEGKIIIPDLFAGNGVVHAIDNVLIYFETTP